MLWEAKKKTARLAPPRTLSSGTSILIVAPARLLRPARYVELGVHQASSGSKQLAAGVALVASDVGGSRDIVVQGKTGVRFPAGDREAAAKAMLDLLSDPPELARMGERARLRAERSFSVGRSLEGFEEVLLRAASLPCVGSAGT